MFDTRFFKGDDAFRADSKSRTITGYAIVFNQRAQIGPDLWEEILPEAVDRSLDGGDDIRALKDHNKEQVIGRRSKGTLRLFKDTYGVRAEIDVPETQVGNDLLVSVMRGDYDGMSFSFFEPKYDVRRENGKLIGILRDMRIREVSPVSFPAYTATTLAMRSVQEWQQEQTQTKRASDLLFEFNQKLRERRR
jgi:HK97 family phage prohead protease